MSAFQGIDEFIAVAEAGGFTAAARRLGVSTSHVSRQISQLEQRLKTALFARSTRSVKLTDPGRDYYQRCSELLSGLQEANEGLSDVQVNLSGTLKISAGGVFAEQHIAPALVKFAAQHPDLKIEMDFSSRLVNFVEEGYDFSVRYGRLRDSGLVARKLVDRKMVAVASPGYLQDHGQPSSPEDLSQHQCIVVNNDNWRFLDDGKELTTRVSGRWKSNNAAAAVSACKAGLGIAYMPRTSFAGAIDEGELIPVLEPYWSNRQSTWIVYQNRHYLPAKARLAIDFLFSEFADWQE
ncbi:MAG: glutathione-dependent formaldehyde neutralization regulator [Candidatus Pelagadaptatus aseana]|uniref:LysR family transcriptional regulator n=1 Tax=Candidatus Pelagadaptatus aseana TaxID=3120508 RepID=UPI0039B1DCD6